MSLGIRSAYQLYILKANMVQNRLAVETNQRKKKWGRRRRQIAASKLRTPKILARRGLTVNPALPSRCILIYFGRYFLSKSDTNAS
jgi:hypothetical protein